VVTAGVGAGQRHPMASFVLSTKEKEKRLKIFHTTHTQPYTEGGAMST